MSDMWNVAFQNAWFGPFVVPNAYVVPYTVPAPPVVVRTGWAYNYGPMDGPLEALIHAQSFACRPGAGCPTLGDAEPRPEMGLKPVFCKPGHVPVQTGVPGQSKCIPWSAPSAMITGAGPNTVSKMTPPNWPTARTFPVRPFYGFQEF